jgi:L,D-peptidoglycan transpeptidase YkuD (ErfK/YbiS/YcfS/YnhG family)
LGRNGIVSFKREGDGGTPRGSMALIAGYFRRRGPIRAATRLPMTEISPGLGWCDDSGAPNYNRPVRLPFTASHERMYRADGLYDTCLVLDWNLRERRRFAGSAIFLHIARTGYEPTEGCIAISARDMALLLPHLSRSTLLTVGKALRLPSSR